MAIEYRFNYYAVTASVVKTTTINGRTVTQSSQVPTFYLSEEVHGITSEDHAVAVATDIIVNNVLKDPSIKVHVTAVKI